MRTRIALAAIVPVACITITSLTLSATEQSAQAQTTPSHPDMGKSSMAANQLIAFRSLGASTPVATGSALLLNAAGPLSAFVASTVPATATTPSSATVVVTPAVVTTPVPTAPAEPAAPVDTVTPAQRAEWERVAVCEEGGNWAADGGRFSGGLGITRSNWAAYGGGEYAPSGALATEDQQIMVAERIQSTPPDQYGCGSW